MFDVVMIGKRIAERRKQKNMTQFELADAMGISFQAVSNWERGNSMPDISKLTELSDILGTTVDELLGKENPVVGKMIHGEKIDMAEVSAEDMVEAAEISKPRQVEEVVKNSRIADIVPLLPFLDEDYIDELAEKHRDDDEGIRYLLPFLTEDTVDKLALDYFKEGKNITHLLPFMTEDAVKAMADDAFAKGGVKKLVQYAAFLNEDDIREYAEKIVQKKE